MEIRIRVEGDDDGRELASLYGWLVQDPYVDQDKTVRLEASMGEPDAMGGAFDAIIAIVGDGIALGGLIVAYQSWRDSRPHRNTASIQSGGIVVNITDSSPETVHRIVQALNDPAES
jgi:Effector Associated Constant Component 1